jgi:DNA-binding NarL/FixJ family response regulator
MQQIPEHVKPPETHDYRLTNREKEVLACMVNGLSYKMIADQLNISYETVRSHVKKIYEKLHVASMTEVVAKAINQRIV